MLGAKLCTIVGMKIRASMHRIDSKEEGKTGEAYIKYEGHEGT